MFLYETTFDDTYIIHCNLHTHQSTRMSHQLPPSTIVDREPWSPASHSLFPAAARARAALLVLSLYEIHEQHHLDSAGNTNGIAARDFVTCVLRFVITREME